MKKFTRLWQLMMVIMLSSSVAFAQVKVAKKEKATNPMATTAVSMQKQAEQAEQAEMLIYKQQLVEQAELEITQTANTSNGYVSTSATLIKPISNAVYDPKLYPPQDQGGEDIATAIALTGTLPITSSGTTAGYLDDYDEVCPYTGSIAPDVVYSYTPAADMDVVIDLCGSAYDTKVFVYENTYTPGVPFACNDDFYTAAGDPCGQWVSQIDSAHLIAGNTYYIVIDGYSGADFGAYSLEIRDWVAPPDCVWGVDVVCPPGSLTESEACGLDLNGGCNMAVGTEAWEPVPEAGATICGTTWADGGTRDTDWFEVTLTASSTVVLTANSDQNIIYGGISVDGTVIAVNPDCATAGFIAPNTSAGPCAETTLDLGELAPGTYWFFLGMTVYEGFPCDVNYFLTFDITPLPCSAPATLTTTDITGTTAKANWQDADGVGLYDIVWGAPGFDPDVPDNSAYGLSFLFAPFFYNFSGLTAGANYEWYVRTDCGTDEASGWAGPAAFTTSCPTYSTPWTEGFEGGTLPVCWVQETADNLNWTIFSGSTGSVNTGPTAAYSGTYYAYVETSGSLAGYVATLYTPEIDLSALTTPQLAFAYHMWGDPGMSPNGKLEVDITTDAGLTYTNVWQKIGDQGNSWFTAAVDLSAYSGTVGFRIVGTVNDDYTGGGQTWENDFAIDDFGVIETPTCPGPTGLTAINLTLTGATLAWTPGGAETNWELEIGSAGFTPTGVATEPTVTPNPEYMWSAGTAGMSYDYYVRAICGPGEESSWAGPLTFTLPCEVTCPPGGIAENEPCGTDVNGGCNMVTPAFEAINPGDIICGTTWADGGSRDTDWFELTLASPGIVTMTVECTAETAFGMIEQIAPGCPGCDNITGSISPFLVGAACTIETITTQTLEAGTYYFFVGLTVFEGFPCDVDYIATWTVTPYTAYPGEFCSNALPASLGINSAAQQPVWYSFVGNDEFVQVTSCLDPQEIDTDLEVWDGCCGSLIAFNDDAACANYSFSTTLDFFAASGTTYYLRWLDTYGTDPFDFEITSGLPAATIMDMAYDATVVENGTASANLAFGNTGNFRLDYSADIEFPGGTVVLADDFETGLGAWTVIDNGGTCVWDLDGNLAVPRGNLAGTGDCATADSDRCGSGTTMDTELHSAAFSLAGFADAQLTFDTYYSDISTGVGTDMAMVDISTDGGATWINLLTWDEDHFGESVTLSLTGYAGQANCMLSFHYIAAGWDWYWQIDNVMLNGYVGMIPPTGWLTLDGGTSASGSVEVGADANNHTIGFDATGLAADTYTAMIDVSTNEPGADATYSIPVSLTVVAGAGYFISGILTYDNALATPMDNVTMMVMDGNILMGSSSVTDGAGVYSLAGLPDGNFTFMPTTGKARGGTGLVDVVQTRQFLLGQITFTPIQQLAADVSGGGIGLLDVVQMRQFLLGTITDAAWVPYHYFDTNVTISGGNVTQGLKSLCGGDPDKSYTPPAG